MKDAERERIIYKKVSTVAELCAVLQKEFRNELYGKPTDIIGFGALGKEIANSLAPLVGKKEICYYDFNKTSDPDFHYFDFNDMLAKSEIMIITDPAYLKLFEDATIFNPQTQFFALF